MKQSSTERFLRAMPTEKLKEWQNLYQALIAGDFGAKKRKPLLPHQMPWMIPAWKKGAVYVDRILKERETVNDRT